MIQMKRCLVIDDFEVIRTVARNILEQNGYMVLEAATTTQALEQCRTELPHVILLDWQTPGISTLEFLTGLRQLVRGVPPRVIYCATTRDRDDIARVMAAGASDVLEKPFDRLSLLSKLTPRSEAA